MRWHDILMDISELRNRVVGKKTVEDTILDGILSRSITEILDLRARRDDLLRSNNTFEQRARNAERELREVHKVNERILSLYMALLGDSAPPIIARPLAEYHEGMGDVLWWKFPITEPPYVGTPNDLGFDVRVDVEIRTASTYQGSARRDGENMATDPATRRFMVGGWPGYHTHFTTIPLPVTPEKV